MFSTLLFFSVGYITHSTPLSSFLSSLEYSPINVLPQLNNFLEIIHVGKADHARITLSNRQEIIINNLKCPNHHNYLDFIQNWVDGSIP